VPEDVRLGEGEKLFDFLAECIHSFMESRQLKGCNLPLGKYFSVPVSLYFSILLYLYIPIGFTFSFPMTQKGLDVGILVSWTKSFNCSGVVGQDGISKYNLII